MLALSGWLSHHYRKYHILSQAVPIRLPRGMSVAERKRKVEYVDEDRDQPILRRLPAGPRRAVGEELARLQRGENAEQLQQFRPLPDFGKGVGELKRGAWRIVLSTVIDPTCIWIVCVFRKDAGEKGEMRKSHKILIEASLRRLAGQIEPSSKTTH